VIDVSRPSTGVCVLTLDRPERGNALSADLVDTLTEAFQREASSGANHTVVLAGRGRHLCTGFDLSGLERESDASLLARLVRIELLLDAIWRAPVRTAVIGIGRITGAGADLFCVCDQRWIHPQASLRFPGAAGFGIVLGTRRLAARVGEARALEWVSQASPIDAPLALSSGLATDALGPGPAEGLALPDSLLQAPSVDPVTCAALRAALRAPDADADLAALVRSAARPGLRERIDAWRAASTTVQHTAPATALRVAPPAGDTSPFPTR
jgi:enoyl-CoA hydratase